MRTSTRLHTAAVALAGLLLTASVTAPPAQAVAPENPFNAQSLSTWQTDGTVWTMASARGRVFVGGTFGHVRAPGTAVGDASSLARADVAVLDAATGAPTSCSIDVSRDGGGATVRSMATSPDGSTLYLGGSFSRVDGTARANLAAVDVDTCSLLPYDPSPTGAVMAITATAGTIYLGGRFLAVGDQDRSRLAATDPEGHLLAWAPVVEDEILGLGVDPTNGNVVLGGRMDVVNGADSHDLAVVDGTTGTTNVHTYPQPYFPYAEGQGQRHGNSAIKAVATDATGFYIGAEGTGSGLFDGRAAFDWGTYEQRWRDTCLGATQALTVYRGVLFNANHLHSCETEDLFEDGVRRHLNAESTTTKKLIPWWPNTNDGTGEGLGPRAVVVAASGSSHYLWYGGEFTTVDSKGQQGLTRFGEGGAGAAPRAPQAPNVVSTTPGEVRVTVRATDDHDDRDLTYLLYRGTSTTPIATLSAASLPYDHPQLSFTDRGLVAGSSQSYRVRASDGTQLSGWSAPRTATVAAAKDSYAALVTADGASEYFQMEEPDGSAAANSGRSQLAGSYVSSGTRATAPGALSVHPGTSSRFSGATGFLRTDSRRPAPTSYSLEAWFKSTSSEGGALIGFANRAGLNGAVVANPSRYDRLVYLGQDGRLHFGTQGSTRVTLNSTAAYNDGQWHQVVATQGPAGMVLYADGKKVASGSTTTAMSINGYWRIAGTKMSTAWPSSPVTGFFSGDLDEVAVYDKVLSSIQVADHRSVARGVPTTVSQTVVASADSSVKSSSTTKNYGKASTLPADGSPATSAYLRFDLPAAPAGRTLTGAVLRVRTAIGSSAGSTGTYDVRLTGTGWTETRVTWQNRPSATTKVGALKATKPATTFPSTLDTSAVATKLGGPLSLAVLGTSSNGISLVAREAGTSSHRPQLVLTYH